MRHFLVLLLASACGGGTEPACPDVPPASTGGEAPSAAALDPELVALARTAQGVDRVVVRVDEAGHVVKLAVYHHDESVVAESVRTAAIAAFPGATVRHFESERYADLGRVNEVEVQTSDGRECELSVADDGHEVYRECHVDPATLPEAIVAGLRRVVASGAIEEAETKERDGAIATYSIEVRDGDQLHYVVLEPDGALQGHYLRVPAVVDVPVPLR